MNRLRPGDVVWVIVHNISYKTTVTGRPFDCWRHDFAGITCYGNKVIYFSLYGDKYYGRFLT